MLNRIRAAVSQFIEREDGPTAVEYAVMVALIAVAIIGSVTALGGAINTKFGEVKTAVGGLGTAATP